jgi:hypothetical protein
MCTEYLDKRDLERGDLAVQEDSSQIQLHLETNINIGPVYRPIFAISKAVNGVAEGGDKLLTETTKV